jgi:ABC-type glutathione transport system ATPase component
MTEATIETPQTSAMPKPEVSSSNGKSQVLIAMKNIWKTYDMGAEKVHALHGVSFEVHRGEYLAIIDPSAPANRP